MSSSQTSSSVDDTKTNTTSRSRSNSSCCLPQHPAMVIKRKVSSSNQSSCSSLGVLDIHHHDLPLFARKDLVVGELLGRGRFSQVHALEKVNGLPSDQPYVMKHLQRKLFQNRTHRRIAKDLTSALADLVLEAMYLSKLNHPHIVSLRGLTLRGTSVLKQKGATEEDYFLILDRMVHGTLDQRIQEWKNNRDHQHNTSSEQQQQQQQPYQPSDIIMQKANYAQQIADALQYLHEHHILYRDLKPENVGFVEPSKVQLYDFGLARELPESAEDNPDRVYTLSPSGTRRYMAVEIFNHNNNNSKGKYKYNYKADVYSWAMVFYEMLALVKPFADFTVQNHQELVCRLGGRPRMDDIDWPDEYGENDEDGGDDEKNYNYDNLDTLPEDLQALLHQAWHQDPKQRPSMAEVCTRLQSAIDKHAIVKRHRTGQCSNNDNDEKHISNKDIPADEDVSKSLSLLKIPSRETDCPVMTVLRNKESTSEWTASTDPLASDDDDDDEYDSSEHQEEFDTLGTAAAARAKAGSSTFNSNQKNKKKDQQKQHYRRLPQAA